MRTFGLILLAFVAGVAVLVAVLSWQGRAAREYGREAVRAAAQAGPLTAERPCAAVLGREPPATVQGCVVGPVEGQARATLTLEGGRVFQVAP
ncbi:hypothetical protein [Deinococcus budaensis]|uniref:Uncharacterized protein n=1 Tax=Deinococcus budaensis TaxID=1665626 RepID=A0A7W8LP70_9DEIO|nr:hypothetical protein [Deinococcus budaensis]MBB5233225.1 hypothetical protein [Deinococcus budaensis]